MNAAEMLARDLVLRVCASQGEFRRDWLTSAAGDAMAKRVVPLVVAPGADPGLAGAIAGAAAEMGADRVLACRTRAAFMYEDVTVLPVSAKDLHELALRWGHPDDYLVCLPDSSAAVLVSTAGYALGAGPPVFLAALAGPDVAAARARFTAWARESGDQRLRLVAGRHGGVPSSCHASRATLRPDIPERLSELAAAVRSRSGLTAVLRACRAGADWGVVALIVITLLSAPRASHVLPVLGGTLWLLLQVFVLARTHTLSWAAYLRMTAAGATWAVAVAAVEWLAGGPGGGPGQAFAGPFEEIAALIPLMVFWLAGRHRFTRLAAADYVLLGVASGSGFALARGTAAALGTAGAGWDVAALLPGWMDVGSVRFSGYAVSTGLVTAGIGLAMAARSAGQERPGTRWRLWRPLAWLLPLALLGLVMLDHYHYDAVAAGARVPSWVSRLHAAVGDGHASRWLLLVALAVTVAADFRAQQRVVGLVPPLPGVPSWAGLARTARGSQISARSRWPDGDIRGRAARLWAGLRAAAAEALVTTGHEIAFMLVVARPRRGRRSLFAGSLAFIRQRRELAMRDARSGDRARRDVPRRAALWAAWRGLTGALALGGPAAFAVLLLLSAQHVRLASSAPRPAERNGTAAVPHQARLAARRIGPEASGAGPLPGVAAAFQAARVVQAVTPRRPAPVAGARRAAPVAGARPADLASLNASLRAWFGEFIPAGQVLVVAAGLGVLVLLSSGWVTPVPLPGSRDRRSSGRILRGLAAVPPPGQLVLAAGRLMGEMLPPTTAELLQGKPVARPYEQLPVAQQVLSPVPLLQAKLSDTQVEALPAAPRRRPTGDDLHRGGWLFPPERVRRWLGHAPEFGVESTAASGEPADSVRLTADLTRALRQIAESAASFRFEQVIFRNQPARAVVDAATGAAVFFTPAGEFTGCALLTEEQVFRLVLERRLG